MGKQRGRRRPGRGGKGGKGGRKGMLKVDLDTGEVVGGRQGAKGDVGPSEEVEEAKHTLLYKSNRRQGGGRGELSTLGVGDGKRGKGGIKRRRVVASISFSESSSSSSLTPSESRSDGGNDGREPDPKRAKRSKKAKKRRRRKKEREGDAYDQLLSTIGTSERFQELLRRRKLEEQGREDAAAAAAAAAAADGMNGDAGSEVEDDEDSFDAALPDDIVPLPGLESDSGSEAADDMDAVPTAPVKEKAPDIDEAVTVEDGLDADNEDEALRLDLRDLTASQDRDEDLTATDPYVQHFDYVAEAEEIAAAQERRRFGFARSVPGVGLVTSVAPSPVSGPSGEDGEDEGEATTEANPPQTIDDFPIKQRLAKAWPGRNAPEGSETFSPLQAHLLSAMSRYEDVLCVREDTGDELDAIRRSWLLHALNHVLKTKDTVLGNNARLAKAAAKAAKRKKKSRRSLPGADLLPEYRDQGFTRPKVLILTPTRHSCLEIVTTLLDIMPEKLRGTLYNKKRFREEFEADEDEQVDAYMQTKPADFQRQFGGLADDYFRLGLSLTRASVRFFGDFYRADILIASPLGLRLITGTDGDGEQSERDFLSSIEMVIVDQASMLQMQNWARVREVFAALNRLPRTQRDADFSRIREWYLNGWARHYRQTLVFGRYLTPEVKALFGRSCQGLSNAHIIRPVKYPGAVSYVSREIKQVVMRLPPVSHADAPDARFRFFTEELLPRLLASFSSGLCIFVPSYYDYLRLRTHFAQMKSVGAVLASEYTKPNSLQRARTMFFQKRAQILLYTERLHFFKRYKIRGMRAVVFYSPPLNPAFYHEILNVMEDEVTLSSWIMFSKWDAMRMERIFGTRRAAKLLESKKATHVYM